MKFYETHFDDYCRSVEKHNIHPECHGKTSGGIVPRNWIVYGPSGVGKYSQVLYMMRAFSPTQLKCDKKIKVSTEKQSYKYRMSDVHFEIDMSLLGCNSKILWHEIYKQIVDIVTIRPEKMAFILCKNFHSIHNELLEIFYSYMQKHCHGYEGKYREVQLYFILITEHISFLPDCILEHCSILRVSRPNQEAILQCCQTNKIKDGASTVLLHVPIEGIVNIKEVYSFSLLTSTEEIPVDHFNLVCDTLIQEMLKLKQGEQSHPLTQFRDYLYDILIYNLDGLECIWYIYQYFVKHGHIDITGQSNKDFMRNFVTIVKQYGNNYRSIFHLEHAIFCILAILH